MKINNVTVGSDPELFIVNGKTGKVVSSVGMIPGEKGNPWVGPGMGMGYGLETDNILAEFNIPPVTTKEDFVNSLEFMKGYIRDFVKNINQDYDILCSASQIVDKDQLQSDQARLFGCSEDYNAYTEDVNPKPEGEKTNLRSAGFHVHLGFSDHDNVPLCLELIKYLDQYLGIPSLIVDKDSRRRNLYGKAGCFRLTSYGIEYRTLSAAMYSSPERSSFVWDCVERAIRACNEGQELIPSDIVVETINSSNVEMAEKLIEEYNLLIY